MWNLLFLCEDEDLHICISVPLMYLMDLVSKMFSAALFCYNNYNRERWKG